VAGGSLQPLIAVSLSPAAGDCILTGNFCEETSTAASIATPIVEVTAGTAVACNNRIAGFGRTIGLSIITTPSPAKVTIIGNIVATQISLDVNGTISTTPTAPWAALNIIV
jgi:hypothetical protein